MHLWQKIKSLFLKYATWVAGLLVIAIIALSAYSTGLKERNKQDLVENTNTIVSELRTALCGDIPIEKCNQAELLRETKELLDRQALVLCTMFRQLADPTETPERVRKICKIEIQRFNQEVNGANTTGPQAQGQPRDSGSKPQANNSGGSNNGGGNEQPNEPVRVLGIPVCVPLTSVCVRQN